MLCKPTLEEWNWHVLMLGQAMLGAISDNFRQVSLRFAGDYWEIIVVLERANIEDEREISEIADATSIFLLDLQDQLSPNVTKRIETKMIISDQPLDIRSSETVRAVLSKRII